MKFISNQQQNKTQQLWQYKNAEQPTIINQGLSMDN